MPIAATDLKLWGSVAAPEADTGTAGGIIQDDNHASGGRKYTMVDISATGQVEALSSTTDTRVLTVYGRDVTGAIVTDAITLNGTTPAQAGTPKSFERIEKAVLASIVAGKTVTLRKATDDVTILTLEENCIEGRRAFYDAASAVGTMTRFELVYLQNDHATLTLTNAKVALTADPAVNLEIQVAAAKGDVSSVTNRVTSPGGTFIDGTALQDVPTGQLAAGERISVWIKQTLAGGAAAFKNTWTLQLQGTSV
jgi:hypothetical protein